MLNAFLDVWLTRVIRKQAEQDHDFSGTAVVLVVAPMGSAARSCILATRKSKACQARCCANILVVVTSPKNTASFVPAARQGGSESATNMIPAPRVL